MSRLSLPSDWREKLPKALAVGLWAGAALGSAFVCWNAGRYLEVLPQAREQAVMQSFVVCALATPLGWALWAGFIIRPQEGAGGPASS